MFANSDFSYTGWLNNRADTKKHSAQYELEPHQKGWLRGFGVLKNNTHFWIHRLSEFQSLLRLIYVRYGPNTCSQRRRVAEANVRSRSSALCGVHLIQVSLNFMHMVNPALMRGQCLLQDDELHLFVFLFGLQEGNFSEFIGTAFWTELVDKTRQSSILVGFRQLSLAFSAIFITIVLFDHYILHYLKIVGTWGFSPSLEFWNQGPIVRTRVSANPGFFFFLSKALNRIIFSILFRVSNHQIVGKEN